MTDAAANLAAVPPSPPPSPSPPTRPAFVPARPPRFWRIRRFFKSLNPLTLLLGPVFQRDMRTSGRRKGVYFARFVVLIIPAVIVALVFMSTSVNARYGYGSAAGRIQSLQQVAFAVAASIAWCQLVTLSFIAPLLTAGAIVEERTARALSVIAASPLSPGRIIGGLFTARLVHLAILAALPLPLILAIRTFGGLETSFVLWSSAVAVCSATAMAAAGLWGSTRATRPAVAVSFAVLLLIVHWVAPLLYVLCDAAIHGWRQPNFEPCIISPPVALALLCADTTGLFGLSPTQVALVNCAISLAIAAVALLAARHQLARLIATDRVELVRQPTRRQRRKALRNPAPGYDPQAPEPPPAPPTGPDGEHHTESRTVTGNPVLWRELRQPLFGAAWKRWLGITGIVALVAIIHLTTLRYGSDAGIVIVSVPSIGALVLLLLSAATVPAGAITTELEARTWATLLTTPLTSNQILLPKVAGAMRRLWPPFLFITFHLIICAARGLAPLGAVVFSLIHFAAFAAFLCSTGTFFSLCSRKSAVASTLNLAMAFAIWLLVPIVLSILIGITLNGRGDDLISYLYLSNPVVTYGAGILGLANDRPTYDMVEANMGPGEFYAWWFASLLTYLGIAYGFMLIAKAGFQRLATARV